MYDYCGTETNNGISKLHMPIMLLNFFQLKLCYFCKESTAECKSTDIWINIDTASEITTLCLKTWVEEMRQMPRKESDLRF